MKRRIESCRTRDFVSIELTAASCLPAFLVPKPTPTQANMDKGLIKTTIFCKGPPVWVSCYLGGRNVHLLLAEMWIALRRL